MVEVSDKDIIEAMQQFGGSFIKALGAACQRADEVNLARLRLAFSDYWVQYADLVRRRRERAVQE